MKVLVCSVCFTIGVFCGLGFLVAVPNREMAGAAVGFGVAAAVFTVLGILAVIYIPKERPLSQESDPAFEPADRERAKRGILLDFAAKPHKGEKWLLERMANGVVLRNSRDEVALTIPGHEVVTRIKYPATGNRVSNIIVIDDDGQPLLFEPNVPANTKVSALVQQFIEEHPEAAAPEFVKYAKRDLIIGSISFLAGCVITIVNFGNAAQQGGNFYVMTGLIGVGLVEIVRGFYYLSKASSLRARGAASAAKDNHDAGG